MTAGNLILVAEDDENDVLLVQRACKKADIKACLHIVNNGQDAIDYLLGRGEYSDREKYPFPYLIVLDLKMPLKTGFEVLEAIKNDKTTRRIPIVVTSSSSIQSDIDRAYDLGANAYLVKPVDFETLLKSFQAVAEFFSRHAAKPHIRTTK